MMLLETYGSKETPVDVIRDLAKQHFGLDLDDHKVRKIKIDADYQWVAAVMKGLAALPHPDGQLS